MFNVRLAGGHLNGKQLFTWLSLAVSLMASFVLSFFPLDVLDEIWDLIESVSEGFLTYPCGKYNNLIKRAETFSISLKGSRLLVFVDLYSLEYKIKRHAIYFYLFSFNFYVKQEKITNVPS